MGDARVPCAHRREAAAAGPDAEVQAAQGQAPEDAGEWESNREETPAQQSC